MMNIILKDGRKELYQWDTGRQIQFDDPASGQAHFANKLFGRSMDVDIVDGVCTIPDELLQTGRPLHVYAWVGTARDGYTKTEKVFPVIPRNKPSDYVFTPTDQKTLEDLQNQIGDLSNLKTKYKDNLVGAINEAAASGGSKDAVTYTPQTLTEEQKSQARTNIGAEKAGTAYTKPASGIPKSDLEKSVQTSLNKADTAISLGLTSATPGQIIKVRAVQDGKPTEWEAVDMPGGGGVQPDWNQNDSTQPDYIKNRPFYTDDPVETVLVEESTVSFSVAGGIYQGKFSSTFSPTIGETYKVYWDGAAYECACVNVNDTPIIGNLSIIGAGSDTGDPFCMIVPGSGEIIIVSTDTSDSHTVSISGLATEVVKIDEKYLPDTVATKSEVEATQEVLDGVFSSVATFTFDKQTSGRDTFVFNAFHYYKISDFNPAPDDVTSFKGTRESGDEFSEITIGSNCVGYGLFIVVASAGGCSIPITEPSTDSFDAPSAGLYAQYEEGDQYMTAGTGEFTLRSSTGSLPITGLLLKSSTADSSKKFKITVDDTGTLKATEVTDV